MSNRAMARVVAVQRFGGGSQSRSADPHATVRERVFDLIGAGQVTQAIDLMIAHHQLPLDRTRFTIHVGQRAGLVGGLVHAVTLCPLDAPDQVVAEERRVAEGEQHGQSTYRPDRGSVIINPSVLPTRGGPVSYQYFVHLLAHELAFHVPGCPSRTVPGTPEYRAQLAAEEFEAYFNGVFPSTGLPALTGSDRLWPIRMAVDEYDRIPADLRTGRRRDMYHQVLADGARTLMEMIDGLGLLDWGQRVPLVAEGLGYLNRLPPDRLTPELVNIQHRLGGLAGR